MAVAVAASGVMVVAAGVAETAVMVGAVRVAGRVGGSVGVVEHADLAVSWARVAPVGS